MSVHIYGASDDLIEVDGDVSAEFGAYDSPGDYLVLSCGLIAHIVYGDGGTWQITVLRKGTEPFIVAKATGPDDDYTDHLRVSGPVQWVHRLSLRRLHHESTDREEG